MAEFSAVETPERGLVFDGLVSFVDATSQTIRIAGLAGFGDTFFNTWTAWCVKKANSTTTVPYHLGPSVLTYTSALGQFTFTAPTGLIIGDYLYLMHPSIPIGAWLADLLARIGNPLADTLASLTAKWGNSPLSFAAHQARVYHEQPPVSFILATTIAEQDIFNWTAAYVYPAYGHVLRRIRLNCNNPGVATVTIRLYELENLVLVARTHVINNLNFGFARSLMDMFGIPEIAGHVVQMTVADNANAGIPVLGSYDYALTS